MTTAPRRTLEILEGVIHDAIWVSVSFRDVLDPHALNLKLEVRVIRESIHKSR